MIFSLTEILEAILLGLLFGIIFGIVITLKVFMKKKLSFKDIHKIFYEDEEAE